ncbi:MAG: translation initiation factor IF-6 [Candidatus Bilamarchaeaceae archaeon]
MSIRQFTYYGNSWIGMFIKANDLFTFIPVDSLDVVERTVAKYLKTKVVRTTVAQSNLLGLYIAINNNGVVLPNVVDDAELKAFRATGLNVYISEDKHNAHGNNIAVNNKIGIINPEISQAERKKISDTLGVELIPMSIAGYKTVGSSCIVTDRGFLVHYNTSNDEFKLLESIFKVKGAKGTVNTGSGFVSYGVITNNKGFVAGEDTTAFELGQLVSAMDFIDNA